MKPLNGNAPDKAGRPTGAQRKHNTEKHHKSLGTIAAIQNWKWLTGYELEEARQFYSAGGFLWKEAVTCVTLALLRAWRVL
jgi:hypothetical protein